jgi:catechol 2,3-dioxygenase-like lactoylglutathione lyase family enzyme
MPLTGLDHYFVRANDLERTKHFYCDVLGFEEMPRPDFPFPGYWLGVGGRIQVHMGAHGIPNADRYYLGSTPRSALDNTGTVDHIAFLANDPEGFAKRFASLGIEVRKRYLPAVKLFQMFVRDPDGVVIELNFNGIDAEPDWGAGSESYAEMPRVDATTS